MSHFKAYGSCSNTNIDGIEEEWTIKKLDANLQLNLGPNQRVTLQSLQYYVRPKTRIQDYCSTKHTQCLGILYSSVTNVTILDPCGFMLIVYN